MTHDHAARESFRDLAATFAIMIVLGSSSVHAQDVGDVAGVREFVPVDSTTPSVHASTIVETPAHTLMVAWFGGSAEGGDDVEIWLSRKERDNGWSAPRAVTSTPSIPVWNPVLFADADTVWLFFKVGPSPREWVGAYHRSTDDGRSWSEVTYLPAGLLGPIRTKPIVLRDGSWLAGSSVEAGYRWDSPADAPYRSWAVWVERTEDRGETWTKHGPVSVPGESFGIIQPTLWQTANGEVRMLMRSTERIGRIVASSSSDGGRTWTPAHATSLPNPNAGVDVARIDDGRLMLVYNHLSEGRRAIHLATSDDDGESWGPPHLLEEGPGGVLVSGRHPGRRRHDSHHVYVAACPDPAPGRRSRAVVLEVGRLTKEDDMTVKFEGGKNIAMKVPPHQHEATVRFYRDLLGLEPIGGPAGDAVGFKFGANNLWIDKVPGMSQAELWLEVVTNDTAGAARLLAEAGVIRCDEIEPLGSDFDGFWISSPAAIIHLVDAKDGSWA